MRIQSSKPSRGFTLIELLAVITIIVILAGVIMGGMGFVKDKQARSAASIQLGMLSTALEEYKLDNGVYPPGGEKPNDSNSLYRSLYWGDEVEDDGEGGLAGGGKVYLSQLNPDDDSQGWIEGSGGAARIVDPWGSEFYYRPGTLPDGKMNPEAWNPDFDLWSAGKDGKSSAVDLKAPENKDDILNQS